MSRLSSTQNLSFSSTVIPSSSSQQDHCSWPCRAEFSSPPSRCNAYSKALAVTVTESSQGGAKTHSSAAIQVSTNALRLPKFRKRRDPVEEEREWTKILSDIQELRSAVPVLRTYMKAGKLPKDTLIGMLMDLKKLKEWQFVAEIIVWLRQQHWWKFNEMDHNLLITAYGKLGEPEKAERAIWRLKKSGFAPNVATYTCLIEAYGKRSLFDKAEDILTKMLEEGPMPTALTYQTLIGALIKGAKYGDAERLFDTLEAGTIVKPDLKLFNLMIHAYGKSGKLEEASRLSRKMKALDIPVSVVTYNSLLAYQPCVKDAESIFRQMQRANIEPDVVSYGARLNAFSKAGRGEEALYFFKTMIASGIRPNSTVYNVLLDALANSKMLEEAEAALKQMRRDGFIPDAHSFTSLMNAYVNAKNMEKAQKVLERMKLADVQPNVVTYGTLMKGYAESGDMNEMVNTYELLRNQGLKPSQTVFTIMIQAFGKRDLDKSISWYKEMIASGLTPDKRARNALSALNTPVERKQEVQDLLDNLT